MDRKQGPFWETKSLEELNQKEWESLCDGCGVCCLEKIEDKDAGKIEITSVSCQFLDTSNCRCIVYEGRLLADPDCIRLTPKNIYWITWLPKTCAYRCVTEGKELEWWHPLVSGDPNTVHEAGISVRDKVVPGRYVSPEDIPGSWA
ncbi:YcgN family cysteine cluster protein [Thermodesulfobacteriota bacterium]